MKNTLFGLGLYLILFCEFSSAPGQIQQDDPISKAIALIKEYIVTGKNEIVMVKIVNRHNGIYASVSTLWSGIDSVSVMTHVIDMTGGKSDTSLNFSKQIFLFKLARASYPFNSGATEGGQTILVKKGERETAFDTYYGQVLMNLLRIGK